MPAPTYLVLLKSSMPNFFLQKMKERRVKERDKDKRERERERERDGQLKKYQKFDGENLN